MVLPIRRLADDYELAAGLEGAHRLRAEELGVRNPYVEHGVDRPPINHAAEGRRIEREVSWIHHGVPLRWRMAGRAGFRIMSVVSVSPPPLYFPKERQGSKAQISI